MRRRAVGCTFRGHLYFSFPFDRLVLTGIALAVCLNAVISFAQQSERQPPATQQAKIIRLRQQWFYEQRAYPHKHIPAGARFKAFRQLRKMEATQRRQLSQQTSTTTSTTSATTSATLATTLASSPWTLIGPQPTKTSFAFNPVSGRVSALAVDPTNPSVVYLGGAEGGVWKSTDGGTSWTPLTDHQPSLAVGSIAIDPEKPQTIYVGTGEEDFGFDNYGGAGVLTSTDGGSTWTQLAGPFVGPFGSQSPHCGGAYIGSIAVDPGNSQIILAGAVFSCTASSGIYRSTDGGSTWSLVLGSAQIPYLITGLVFDPTNGNNVYAAVASTAYNSQGGIWKSTNAGLTWTPDNGSGTTTFPGSSAGRISLAIAPASPTTLYAGAASLAGGSATLLGVYKTTNGGAAWTQLTSAPAYCSPQGGSQQCYYDNVVAVSPNDPNIVLLGGSIAPSSTEYSGTLYLSLDGGSTWTDITTDSGGGAIHPDMHAIAFSADGSKMYVGNDGGVWSTSLSPTGAGTWTDLNQTLALTQFYPGLSMDSTTPGRGLAGSQDDGVQGYVGSLQWNWVLCGDGGQTAIDPANSAIAYAGCSYVPGPNNQYFLFKFTPGSGWAPAVNGIDGSDPGFFIPPLAMDPSNPDTLYFGTQRVYQTTDGAANWKSISGYLVVGNEGILSSMSAIAVAPSDSNTVYAGTGDGRLWKATNATSSPQWYSITSGTPNRSITAIAVSPTNPQTAYATFSGYSGFGGDTLGHVFETTTGGTSWTDISGNLPNIPVNGIVVDPDFTNTLYIATDIGVFATTDGGAIWASLGAGLPAVAVMSLKLHHATRILRAASYGRSAWDVQLPAPVGPTAVLSTPTLDFAPQQVGTTSSAQSVTLTNNSTTALAISSITASTNFAETNTCGTSLAAGSNCTLSVTFIPAALGPQTGTVTLTDNAASGSSQTVSLSGKGFSGAVSLSPTGLSFANQLVGTTSTAQTVTLTNSSTAPLTITSIIGSTDFTVASDCPYSTTGALAAGASCHINISFAPRFMGTFVEQITINDSANDSPQTIPVTGTSISPVVTFSAFPPFSDQLVGTKSNQSTTLTNTGTADLAISSISIFQAGSYAFTEADDCPRSPSTIPPGGTCTVTVTFAPTTWGQLTGSLSVHDNELAGEAVPLNMSGNAYSGAAAVSPLTLDFGTVALGQTSAPQTVTLTDSGSSALYVGNIYNELDFTEKDNCPRPTTSPSSLAPGATCTITITFTPTATYTEAGTIGINDSAQGFGQSISVKGTGQSDFTLAVSAGTSSTATVTAGASANYSLTVTPAKGFTQAVSLSCSGTPLGGTCTVSPSSVMLDGTNAQNVKVTVTTAAPGLLPPGPNGGPSPSGEPAINYWWIALLMLTASSALVFRRRRRMPLLAGAMLLAAIALSCGGGGGAGGTTTTPGTPAGTYTLTVTGRSGSLLHQTTLTLTVQ